MRVWYFKPSQVQRTQVDLKSFLEMFDNSFPPHETNPGLNTVRFRRDMAEIDHEADGSARYHGHEGHQVVGAKTAHQDDQGREGEKRGHSFLSLPPPFAKF